MKAPSAPVPPRAGPLPAPSRSAFALQGPSVALDPRTDAVRPDLADIRLAGRIFAPHYAAHVAQRVTEDAVLRAGRDSASEALATLAAGDGFELLDVVGGDAWGVAPGPGLVGYLPASVLEPVAA